METMKLNPAVLLELLKETYAEWSEDKASRLAAALAYHTVFALAPMLVLMISAASLIFQDAAQQQIMAQIDEFVGPKAAEAIADMISGARKPAANLLAGAVGLATLLYGAAGLFGQLQDALNTIWEVAPRPGQGIMAILRQRFLSFTMVLGTWFILLVSLVLSAALAAAGEYMQSMLPLPEILMQIINIIVSVGVITLLFAMIFKVLPDAEIGWNDVWVGAAITALLFTLGKTLLGLWLGRGSAESTYGAAGSLVLILLWINYAAQLLFFGAEFTQVYASRFGSKIVPSPHAVSVTETERARQGMPRAAGVQAASGAPAEATPVEMPEPDSTPARTGKGLDTEYLGAALLGFGAAMFLRKRQRR